jgi:ribonucleoside-triphosphate reductase
MDMINRAFIELMLAGDAEGRGFQYPIPTYNVTEEFDWDSANGRLLFEMTAKYGTPYFQNFIGSDLNPGDVRSMCCRLQLDKRELRKRGGGLFGSDEFTGSIGVVTINLPRIGYLARSKREFYRRLTELMDLAAQSLVIKRKVIQRLLDAGLFPYTRRYLKHLNNHFSTIGIVGMNECLRNYMEKDISSEEGRAFAEEVLDYMRGHLADLQEETGDLFNLEATPAESTSYRLARHDAAHHPDIFASGENEPYYTNSTQLPVDHTGDIFEALDHQESLQTKYTGGTVFHAFLGEAVSDWSACRKLVRAIAENYRIPYFTISPTFSICPDHGYLKGEHFSCPRCGREAEVYSRIVGYYRSVRNWNRGKREEFGHRKLFEEPQLPDDPAERSEGLAGELFPAVPGSDPRMAARAAASMQVATSAAGPEQEAASYLLFTRTACPNCPPVRRMVESSALPGREIAVDGEEGLEAARSYGVMAAPTLIVFDAGGQETGRACNPAEVEALGLRPPQERQ